MLITQVFSVTVHDPSEIILINANLLIKKHFFFLSVLYWLTLFFKLWSSLQDWFELVYKVKRCMYKTSSSWCTYMVIRVALVGLQQYIL